MATKSRINKNKRGLLWQMRHLVATTVTIAAIFFASSASASDDAFWAKYNSATVVSDGNLEPLIEKAAATNATIILEVYAPWCGFCQNFAPVLEDIVQYFQSYDSNLLFVKVAFGHQENAGLINDLGVTGFPSFYYGTAEQFRDMLANPTGAPLGQLNEIVRPPMTAEEAITYIAQKFGEPDPPKFSTVNSTDPSSNTISDSDIPLFTIGVDAYLQDIEKSTSESLAQSFISSSVIERQGSREAFQNWQTWIADAHPSEQCRQGALDILSNFDNLWPYQNNGTNTQEVLDNLPKMRQCGNETDFDSLPYLGCSVGGNPKAYTCGLWQTFHSMSASPTSSFNGSQMFVALYSFIDYFFACSECRQHFLKVADETDPKNVQSADEFNLWLWAKHDEANLRLRKEEIENGSINPQRPKGVFPPPDLCSDCFEHKDNHTNSTGILPVMTYDMLPFLMDFYGPGLNLATTLESGTPVVVSSPDFHSVDDTVEDHYIDTSDAAGNFVNMALGKLLMGAFLLQIIIINER